jgi:streptogramin lyase
MDGPENIACADGCKECPFFLRFDACMPEYATNIFEAACSEAACQYPWPNGGHALAIEQASNGTSAFPPAEDRDAGELTERRGLVSKGGWGSGLLPRSFYPWPPF